MPVRRRLSVHDLVAVAAAAAIGLVAVAALSLPAGSEARPDAVSSPAPAPDRVGAVTTTRRTSVLAAPSAGAGVVSVLRAGILVPVTRARGGFYRVLTPCHVEGWVPAQRVDPHAKADERTPLIVLDPGHGGEQPGAVGRGGLAEKDANLDIVKRVRDLLVEPAAAPMRVFLTRSQDHVAGLEFRTTLANSLGAWALVSVHNNAMPEGPSPVPGTETYFQAASKRSKRLAGLLYEDIFRTLEPVDAPWVAYRDPGAKPRRNSRGTDFYAILRRAEVPAALVEALFISNPPEEKLLRDARVQQAIAGSIRRAIVRYVTTDDPGSGFVQPRPRGDRGSPGRLPARCIDPA